MKSGLLAACAVAALCVVATAGKSSAQSTEALLQRLEAKIDALSKENATLRDRVKRIEHNRSAAPVRVAAYGNTKSDALPPMTTAAMPAARAVVTKAVPMRPGCAQFAGWNAGVNAGAGYYDHRTSDRDRLGSMIDDGLPDTVSSTNGSWFAGAQGGYNWQRNCSLFGVTADWSWTGMKVSEFSGDGDAVTQDTFAVESKMRGVGTLRTKAGVVVDNVLLYATGGLAFANFKRSWTFFQDGPVTTGVFSSSKTKLGLVGGIGAEWAWTPNWSVSSEVLYMQFEKDRTTVVGNGIIGNAGVGYGLDAQDSAFVSRIGVNYRWDGAVVP
jgi:outer membrane immunogenic protein